MRRGWAISTSRISLVRAAVRCRAGMSATSLGSTLTSAWMCGPKPSLSAAQREAVVLPSLVRGIGGASIGRGGHPRWSALLHLAANLPEVDRILVNPAIKRQLCDEVRGDRSWLRLMRPWYGHAAHMHIRFRCPPISTTASRLLSRRPVTAVTQRFNGGSTSWTCRRSHRRRITHHRCRQPAGQ